MSRNISLTDLYDHDKFKKHVNEGVRIMNGQKELFAKCKAERNNTAKEFEIGMIVKLKKYCYAIKLVDVKDGVFTAYFVNKNGSIKKGRTGFFISSLEIKNEIIVKNLDISF